LIRAHRLGRRNRWSFWLQIFQSPSTGEQPPVEDKGPPQGVNLDSFAGPVHVEWDTGAALTPLGQLPFFIDFLKAAGLFDAFVADCPLRYTSAFGSRRRSTALRYVRTVTPSAGGHDVPDARADAFDDGSRRRSTALRYVRTVTPSAGGHDVPDARADAARATLRAAGIGLESTPSGPVGIGSIASLRTRCKSARPATARRSPANGQSQLAALLAGMGKAQPPPAWRSDGRSHAASHAVDATPPAAVPGWGSCNYGSGCHSRPRRSAQAWL